MDTDLDPDDAIGRRLGALRNYTPPIPADDAWKQVETRHRRRRARRNAAVALVTVITIVGAVGAIANLRPSDRRVRVVTPPVSTPSDPPIVSVLTPAPVGNMHVEPAGPYRAGQRVRAFVNPAPTFQLDDPINQAAELCFAYGGGEICDSAVQSRYVEVAAARGMHAYDLTLPGWVHTPTGLRSCADVGCRLEIANSDESRIGTPALTIESGPKPAEPARITGVHRDESLVSLHIDALQPDPSWVGANLPPGADLPAGGLSICAFAGRLLCDALVQPEPPPFDGRPHDLVIATNRLLLTREGWVDCAEYACAIVATRNTDVTTEGGGVGSGAETLAIVPYTLPATTPRMERPSLTIDRAGPFPRDETVVNVTLHNPPPNVDLERLHLGQCAAERLDVTMDCGYRFDPWTRSADGSLRKEWTISDCEDPRGCYLAVTPPAKAYPEVARTPRFTVTR